MLPLVFTHHYRPIVRGLRSCGLPTPWIEKSSLVRRLPSLLYDFLLVAVVLCCIVIYIYTTMQGGLVMEEICALGIGATLFFCGLLVTLYHVTYRHQLKEMTDSIDSLVDSITRSGLVSKQSYQLLYQKDARTMAVLTKNTVIISIVCPFLYCMNVLVTDWLAGSYRLRQPTPIKNPFDDKQPGVYELIASIVSSSLVISCFKKGVNDCLFLALFKILTSSLFYLSTAIEELKQDLIQSMNVTLQQKLVQWIKLHQEVLRNTEQLIAIFSPVVVIYYLNLIGIIVSGLFTVTMKNEDNALQALGVSIYLVLLIFHLLLLSSTAEDLSTKAKKMALAAYDMPWFEMPKKSARMILMAITVCNKDLGITAYRAPIFLLNRETFAKFIFNCISAFVTLIQIKGRYD